MKSCMKDIDNQIKNVYSSKYFDYEYNNQELHFDGKLITQDYISSCSLKFEKLTHVHFMG